MIIKIDNGKDEILTAGKGIFVGKDVNGDKVVAMAGLTPEEMVTLTSYLVEYAMSRVMVDAMLFGKGKDS